MRHALAIAVVLGASAALLRWLPDDPSGLPEIGIRIMTIEATDPIVIGVFAVAAAVVAVLALAGRRRAPEEEILEARAESRFNLLVAVGSGAAAVVLVLLLPSPFWIDVPLAAGVGYGFALAVSGEEDVEDDGAGE